MQNSDLLDKKIKTSLVNQAEKIEESHTLKNRVMTEIRLQNKEAYKMKKVFNVKKVVALAAAITILGSVGVFASGVMKGTVSVSSHNDEVKSYAQAVDMPDKLGYDTTMAMPEKLGDFTFDSAVIGESSQLDEAGKPYGETFKNLYVSYLNENKTRLNMNIDKVFVDEANVLTGDVVNTVNDITMYYNTDNYLFVADESAVTAEDRAVEDLVISYGGAGFERTESTFENVSFMEDGVNYILSVENADMGAEKLFDLAKEWINAR